MVSGLLEVSRESIFEVGSWSDLSLDTGIAWLLLTESGVLGNWRFWFLSFRNDIGLNLESVDVFVDGQITNGAGLVNRPVEFLVLVGDVLGADIGDQSGIPGSGVLVGTTDLRIASVNGGHQVILHSLLNHLRSILFSPLYLVSVVSLVIHPLNVLSVSHSYHQIPLIGVC